MAVRVDFGSLLGRLSDGRSPSLDRVLDAASACFVERGVRGTTIADVAERAGVSRVWVHRVAGSRDDLLHALLAREVERLLQALVVLAPPATDPQTALGDAFGVVVSHFSNHPLVRRLIDTESSVILPALTGDGQFVTLLADTVANAYGAFIGIDPPSLRDLADGVVRLGVSLIIVPRRPGGDTPAELSAFIRNVFGPAVDSLVPTPAP